MYSVKYSSVDPIQNGYLNLVKAIDAGGGTVAATSVQHPFTMVVGGGLDINISRESPTDR